MLGKKGFVWGAVAVCALLFTSCDGVADDPTANLTGTEEQPLMSGTGGGAGGSQPTCPSPKVLICHIPPGNPANAHSICVGQPAVKAHVSHHGDGLGACGGSTTTVTDAGNPPPPPPPPPPPAVDAGVVCQAINAPCSATALCCGTMICLQGENVCAPLIQ